jgi:hypothetical protein
MKNEVEASSPGGSGKEAEQIPFRNGESKQKQILRYRSE